MTRLLGALSRLATKPQTLLVGTALMSAVVGGGIVSLTDGSPKSNLTVVDASLNTEAGQQGNDPSRSVAPAAPSPTTSTTTAVPPTSTTAAPKVTTTTQPRPSTTTKTPVTTAAPTTTVTSTTVTPSTTAPNASPSAAVPSAANPGAAPQVPPAAPAV